MPLRPEGSPGLYRAHGFLFRSDLPLPGAARVSRGEPHATIRLGAVPAGPREGAPDRCRIDAPGVGRFLVSGGRSVLVDPHPEAPVEALVLYLVGPVLGALLRQRGRLVLHANAVEWRGEALAFCGPSRSGKSTLAAAFCARGAASLADDVCSVDFDGADRPRAQPGLSWIKLRPEALPALGGSLPVHPPGVIEERHALPLPPRSGPAPLARLYLLQWSAGGGPEVVRLPGRELWAELLGGVFQPHPADGAAARGRDLLALGRLARGCVVRVLRRPRGGSPHDVVARLLTPAGGFADEGAGLRAKKPFHTRR